MFKRKAPNSVLRRKRHLAGTKRRMSKRRQLTVLDLFCGAGGFSEGFRSAGFVIVKGIDHWRPAVDTYNCNFDLAEAPVDLTSYEENEDLIEALPDTNVIVGSPPCVSFSYSNRLGNADKTEGIRLMKVFFAIVAVKKFKRNSRLLSWYMENVANAARSLPDHYTFAELSLSRWARRNGYSPNQIAIDIRNNQAVENASTFGVPQTRKRLFLSEFLSEAAHRCGYQVTAKNNNHENRKIVSSKAIRSRLPSPTCKRSSRMIEDPFDKSISIPLSKISDHFYETGAYAIHWRDSKALKQSHPYMGRMAFPENEAKPSRTIVATPFPRAREALLYKSEWNRSTNGRYRGPTIREAATLMSFPITYQFVGSEGAKWKLVGNAVCPLVARAHAQNLARRLGLKSRLFPRKALPTSLEKVPNLNTFSPRKYSTSPKRSKRARFRGHPLKAGGMTVALTNYVVTTPSSQSDGRWRCYVTYGIGSGFRIQRITPTTLVRARRAIEKYSVNGRKFLDVMTNGFSERIPNSACLQDLYERDRANEGGSFGPSRLLNEARRVILMHTNKSAKIEAPKKVFSRKYVPVSQLYALFAVGHIVATTRKKGERANE